MSTGIQRGLFPTRQVIVFLAVSVGTTSSLALLSRSMGWTVQSPVWGLLAPIAMWAPAVSRLLVCRTVDREFKTPLPTSRWGRTGAEVILLPLAIPLCIYGAAYAVAWAGGFADFSPGGGRWTSAGQIAANVVINLAILGVVGTFNAMGEEIGWRGYLQPRLDAAGVRASIIVVWLAQLAYHAPLIAGAGYASTGGLAASLGRFAAADLPVTFLWAWGSYRAGSLWPAIFFHSFHNTISQWLFPKFFAGGDDERWLGEGGLLPVAGYVIVGAGVWLWMRLRGPSWQELTRQASARETARELDRSPA